MTPKMPPRVAGITSLEIIAFSAALMFCLGVIPLSSQIANSIVLTNNVNQNEIIISFIIIVDVTLLINAPYLIAAVFNFRNKKSNLNVFIIVLSSLKIIIYFSFLALISINALKYSIFLFIPIIFNGIQVLLIALEIKKEKQNTQIKKYQNQFPDEYPTVDYALYQERYCRKCGSKISINDKYCQCCGARQNN